jgi:hypothetical protein
MHENNFVVTTGATTTTATTTNNNNNNFPYHLYAVLFKFLCGGQTVL